MGLTRILPDLGRGTCMAACRCPQPFAGRRARPWGRSRACGFHRAAGRAI